MFKKRTNKLSRRKLSFCFILLSFSIVCGSSRADEVLNNIYAGNDLTSFGAVADTSGTAIGEASDFATGSGYWQIESVTVWVAPNGNGAIGFNLSIANSTSTQLDSYTAPGQPVGSVDIGTGITTQGNYQFLTYTPSSPLYLSGNSNYWLEMSPDINANFLWEGYGGGSTFNSEGWNYGVQEPLAYNGGSPSLYTGSGHSGPLEFEINAVQVTPVPEPACVGIFATLFPVVLRRVRPKMRRVAKQFDVFE